VTSIDKTESELWWETEVPAIGKTLLIYLRGHVPALRDDHDDLVNESLLSLTKHLDRNSSTLPEAWFGKKRPKRDDRTHLHKLATVILKRRIADNFRKRVKVETQDLEAFNDHLHYSTASRHERRIMLIQVLRVVRSALDEMSSEDRDLIAFVSQDAATRSALNDAERQRLHRIRKRLKAQIARQLGTDVADLLRTSD
jgi:DNA-directed RNA polymerase specialized sigma24 family protein